MADNHFKIHKGATLAPQSAEPSNPTDGDFYYDATLNKFRKYENGSWSDFGSGSGSGINYVTNPDFEAALTDWNTYNDGAVSAPVDGTGGTATALSTTRTTSASEILRETASLKISKSASSAQGQGVSTDITIDPADLGKKLNLSFNYKHLNTNFASGDVKIYVYDIDNTVLLGAVTNDDDGDVIVYTGDGTTFRGSFYATTSLNYRVIFHVTSTNASAWDMIVDNVKAGPEEFAPGAIISEWTSFTPSWNNTTLGTSPHNEGRWRRVGNVMEILVGLSLGTGGAFTGIAGFSIPNGKSADVSNIPSVNSNDQAVGSAVGFDSSGGTFYSLIAQYTNARAQIEFTADAGSKITATSPFTWAVSDQLNVHVMVPISGWKSSNLVSTTESLVSTATLAYKGLSSTSVTGGTPPTFNTKLYDDLNGWDTNGYVVRKKGKYRLTLSGVYAGTNFSDYAIYVDGVQKDIIGAVATLRTSVSGTINVNAGQKIAIGFVTSGTIIDATNVQIYIEEIPEFSIFGVFGETEVITAESSTLTPSGSGLQTLTGNGLTLPAGVWLLVGKMAFGASGGSPGYTRRDIYWSNSNASAAAPAGIISPATSSFSIHRHSSLSDDGLHEVAPSILISTQGEDIYLNTDITCTTYANARLLAEFTAIRIK